MTVLSDKKVEEFTRKRIRRLVDGKGVALSAIALRANVEQDAVKALYNQDGHSKRRVAERTITRLEKSLDELEVSVGMKKRCSACGKELPFGRFHFKAKSPDGIDTKCRDCTKDRKREKAMNNNTENAITAEIVRKVKAEDKRDVENKYMAPYFRLTPKQLDEIPHPGRSEARRIRARGSRDAALRNCRPQKGSRERPDRTRSRGEGLMCMEEFREGELFVYTNGDRWELGQVKAKARDDAYFCWYSTGDTAACTPVDHMHKLANAGWSHVERGGDDDWCEWELVHSGTLFDKFQCSKCGFEFFEPRCVHGYKDLDPKRCPSCGRWVR